MSTKDARAIHSKTFKVVYKDVFFLGQSSFNKLTYNNAQVYSPGTHWAGIILRRGTNSKTPK